MRGMSTSYLFDALNAGLTGAGQSAIDSCTIATGSDDAGSDDAGSDTNAPRSLHVAHKVAGTMDLTVSDAASFVSNVDVLAALTRAIAGLLTDVDASGVSVDLFTMSSFPELVVSPPPSPAHDGDTSHTTLAEAVVSPPPSPARDAAKMLPPSAVACKTAIVEHPQIPRHRFLQVHPSLESNASMMSETSYGPESLAPTPRLLRSPEPAASAVSPRPPPTTPMRMRMSGTEGDSISLPQGTSHVGNLWFKAPIDIPKGGMVQLGAQRSKLARWNLRCSFGPAARRKIRRTSFLYSSGALRGGRG